MLTDRILLYKIVLQFQTALEEKCYIKLDKSKLTTYILPIIKEILGGNSFFKKGKDLVQLNKIFHHTNRIYLSLINDETICHV